MNALDYEDTLRKEVVYEYGSAIGGAFFRYARENNIKLNDLSNPVSTAHRKVLLLADKLYTATKEEIVEIKESLDELKQYLFEVNPCAVV